MPLAAQEYRSIYLYLRNRVGTGVIETVTQREKEQAEDLLKADIRVCTKV